jgi:glyoxylase-like metal-dependent hydrolase (beta-lactamase superfamily II)
MFFLTATQAWSQPVPGSLDVHWNEGASDCTATPQDPLQVHTYEPQTFILRQSPCANFEANFLYLLLGSDKALLIDTGAVADPKEMPLAKTILELLPDKDHKKLPLLVAHTHRHLDHRAGDPQFASLSSVQIVPIDLQGVRAFFGFTNWPNGIGHLDLGGRTVYVIPTPGHNPTHMACYDEPGSFSEISCLTVLIRKMPRLPAPAGARLRERVLPLRRTRPTLPGQAYRFVTKSQCTVSWREDLTALRPFAASTASQGLTILPIPANLWRDHWLPY